MLERGLPLCSQMPGDHTKGWLQTHNGGVVSHCTRAAGGQTEPPVSVPVGWALQLLVSCLCFIPSLPVDLCLYPIPQVNPLLPTVYLAPWPKHGPSRSYPEARGALLASLGKSIDRALSPSPGGIFMLVRGLILRVFPP